MWSIIKNVFAPLVALFILILGNGLFTTLIALRLNLENSGSFLIGSMTAAYYAGFLVAAFGIERSITRVGLIRAFAAFASALAVISMLQGMLVIPWVWLFLRFLGGFATAGLFIVIESWLLALGTNKTRGQILAIYMVTLYAGQALGQFLIELASPASLFLFALSSMLCSLSVIPLAMTKSVSPQFEEPSALSFKLLYQKSASGIAGCVCGGLILSAVYGLFPVYVAEHHSTESNVALFMFVVIFGGMMLQYPVGRISDYVERRKVLTIIAMLIIFASAFIVFAFKWHWTSLFATFVFGGLAFTLYPISISHACDTLESHDIVAGTQALLLAYSIGATLGPLIAPAFIYAFGEDGLFIYFAVTCVLMLLFTSYRRIAKPPTLQEDPFVALPPNTTPIISELDPRSNDTN